MAMNMNFGKTPILSIDGVKQLLILIVLGMSSFSILLPLSPNWVLSRSQSEAAAGGVTAILMALTVCTQVLINPLARKYGWPKLLAIGLFALGAPSCLQSISSSIISVFVSSAVRGVGFGILTVGGATTIAMLVPAERRGAAVGAYGLAVALPQFLLIPAAPVLEDLMGSFAMTLIATLPLMGLFLIQGLEKATRNLAEQEGSFEVIKRPSTLMLIAPTLAILLTVTTAGGALLTFAQQFTTDASSAALLLLCITGFAAPSRWLFGILADRCDLLAMMSSLCAALIVGMAIAFFSTTAAVMEYSNQVIYIGGILIGVSYGGLQSITLTHAFKKGGAARLTRVSVMWNVSFDVGTGLGSLLIGSIAAVMGFSFAFKLITIILMVIAMAAIYQLYASQRRCIN